MSYDITLSCDALNCTAYRIGLKETQLPSGWHEHDGFHYCSKCWPKIVAEMDEEAEEE